MANASVSSSSSTADTDGQIIVASFQSSDGAGAIAARQVKKVTLTAGPASSSAMINVPYTVSKADEVAFNIALQAHGPAAALKLLTRAQFAICDVNGNDTLPVLCGFIVQRHHVFFEGSAFDQLNCNVLDDKWPMTKYRLIGRYEFDPETGAHYYNSAGRCVYNRNGFRSCLDTKFGPRFAPKDNSGYNGTYKGEPSVEPSPGDATAFPRTWRPADVTRYILDTMFASRAAIVPKPTFSLGEQQIGAYIYVPQNIEGILIDRPIRDVDYDGMSVLDALNDILHRSGSFEIAVRAKGNFTSQLQILDANPSTQTPIYLPGYTVSTVAGAMGARNLVKAGSLVEDAAARYPQVNLIGDAPAVEVFASTDISGTGAGLLGQDWTDQEEFDYESYIDRNDNRGGVKNSFTRFEGANLIWARPFCAYRIRDGADIFANTKYAGKRIGGKTPVLMATQLTADNVGNKPAGWQPKPIIVEYKMTAKEYAAAQLNYPTITNLSQWVPCYKADALTLSPDGKTLFLPQLRALRQTWYIKETTPPVAPYGDYDGLQMLPRQIRLNVGVQADWGANSLDKSDPNIIAHRFDGAAPNFTLQMRAGPLAFVDWERIADSRPNGEGGMDPDYAIFPHKAEAGNELFSDFSGPAGAPGADSRAARMTAAKIADVNRVILHGNLDFIGLNGAILPGFAVRLAGDVMDGITGMVKAVTFDSDTQTTQAVFGSNDVSTLFEMRGAPMPKGNGSSSIKPGEPKKTPVSNVPDQPHGPPPEKTDHSTQWKSDYDAGMNYKPKSESSSSDTSSPQYSMGRKPVEDYQDNPTGLGGTDIPKGGAESMAGNSAPDKPSASGPAGDAAGGAGKAGPDGRAPYQGAPRDYAGPDYAPKQSEGKDYSPKPYSGSDHAPGTSGAAKDYTPKPYSGVDYSQPGAAAEQKKTRSDSNAMNKADLAIPESKPNKPRAQRQPDDE